MGVQSPFFHSTPSDFWKCLCPIIPSTVFFPQRRLMLTAHPLPARDYTQHFLQIHSSSPPPHPCELGTCREGNTRAEKQSILPRSHNQEEGKPGVTLQPPTPSTFPGLLGSSHHHPERLRASLPQAPLSMNLWVPGVGTGLSVSPER